MGNQESFIETHFINAESSDPAMKKEELVTAKIITAKPKHDRYYVLVDSKLKFYDHQFVNGENTHPSEYPLDAYLKSGFTFTSGATICEYIDMCFKNNSLTHFVEISTPANEKVIKYQAEHNKTTSTFYMAKTINIVGSPLSIWQNNEICTKLVKHNPLLLAQVANPTEKMMFDAIQKDPYQIAKLQHPTHKMKKFAVEKLPRVVTSIEADEELYLYAISLSMSITGDVMYIAQHGKNLTDKVKVALVTKNGCSLRHIENPTQEIEKIAVYNNIDAYQCVKNKNQKIELFNYVAKKYGKCALQNNHGMSEDDYVRAIEYNKGYTFDMLNNKVAMLQYIPTDKQTSKIVLSAIQFDSKCDMMKHPYYNYGTKKQTLSGTNALSVCPKFRPMCVEYFKNRYNICVKNSWI
jgi:hypothetical protein